MWALWLVGWMGKQTNEMDGWMDGWIYSNCKKLAWSKLYKKENQGSGNNFEGNVLSEPMYIQIK